MLIRRLLHFWAKVGMLLPMAYDNDKRGPSVTLLYAYTAHFVALWGVAWLIVDRRAMGVLAAIGYALATMSLYLIRRLDKVKLDVKDGEFELAGEGDKQEKEDV